jgi:hypothetical protein
MRGQQVPDLTPAQHARRREAPDFSAILGEQFAIVQSRVDDLLRSNPVAAAWIEADPETFAAARLDPADAARIAEEELAELRAWLQQRWDGSPRDTRAMRKLLEYLPGGARIAKWSEAAPYLLAIVVAAHGAVFGPIDLLIIGGFSLAAWLGERLSNEVTARTRATNRRIAERFDALAREQVDRISRWIQTQVPPAAHIELIERLADEVSEAAGRHADAR